MVWSTPDLSPSAVPQLKENEKVVVSVGKVGLYDGETKSAIHADGRVYLTSDRLIYVDNRHPILNSVQISLNQIKSHKFAPRFFKSSAKVSFELQPAVSAGSEESGAQDKSGWICSICSFPNASQLKSCETCGVSRQKDATMNVSAASRKLAPGECPQCTFQNHPSILFCEMCGSSLKEHSSVSIPLGSQVKISFRSGGSHNFYECLLKTTKAAGSVQAASSDGGGVADSANFGDDSGGSASPSESQGKAFGIRRLQAQTKQIQDKNKEVLDRALANTREFQIVMPEVVSLAKRLSCASTSIRSMHEFPIIEGADAQSPETLARQIVDLLIGRDNLLAHAGGMLSLHDAYHLINRCRGLGLISPQQLLAALKLCEPLDLPLRVRELSSGLKVLESRGGIDQALQRLLHWITAESKQLLWRESSGFSARDVSEKFGCSIQVALEELQMAEQRGKLCRDEHTSGLRFFPNKFVT